MAEEKKYTAEDVQRIKDQIATLNQELTKAEACVRAEGLGGLQETLDKLLINKVIMSGKPAPDGECMAMFVRSAEPEMVDSIHRGSPSPTTSLPSVLFSSGAFLASSQICFPRAISSWSSPITNFLSSMLSSLRLRMPPGTRGTSRALR